MNIILLVAVQVFVIRQPLWAMACNDLLQSAAEPSLVSLLEKSPPLPTILKKVFAVSALWEVPRGDVVEANRIDLNRFDSSKDIAKTVRFGVHFTLGEFVRPHSAGNWEGRTVAIVKPLRELEGLINLNPYDTLSLGNTKLTPNTVLIVPKGTQVRPDECHCKIFEYDPLKMNLRAAVDHVIQIEDGWTFRMKDYVNNQVDSTFELDGKTFETSHFFAKFLADKPHVSVGNEFRSKNGDAFRFGPIWQILLTHLEHFYSPSISDDKQRWWIRSQGFAPNAPGDSKAKFQVLVIEHHLEKLKQSPFIEKIPREDRKSLTDIFRVISGMINLAKLDLYLREKHSKTLVDTDLPLELWAVRSDLDRLISTAEHKPNYIERLAKKPDLKPKKYDYAGLLATLTNAERPEFLRRHANIIPPEIFTDVLLYLDVLLKEDPQLQ